MKDFIQNTCIHCQNSMPAIRNLVADHILQYKESLLQSFESPEEVHHGAELLKLWIKTIASDCEEIARYGTSKYLQKSTD